LYSVINFNKIKYLYTYSYLIFNTQIYVYKSLQGSLIKKNSQSNLYLKTPIHPLRSWKKKRKKGDTKMEKKGGGRKNGKPRERKKKKNKGKDT
jgi:hypothetical protein